MKTLNIDGHDVSYNKVGKGEPIVFLHGWMIPKECFVPIVKYLSKEYECISFDMPGFGSSKSAHPLDLDDALGIIDGVVKQLVGKRSYHLFGNSMGGSLACLHAHSQMVKGLSKLKTLVIRSPLLLHQQLPSLLKFHLVEEVVIKAASIKPIGHKMRQYLESVVEHGAEEIDSNIRKAIEYSFDNMCETSARQIASGVLDQDLFEKLSQLTIPRLYLHPLKDEMLDPEIVLKEIEKNHQVNVSCTGGNSHSMLNDDIEKLSNIVKDFLK
jgi:pimeloyl-ACP methyl ester carboxylesterase